MTEESSPTLRRPYLRQHFFVRKHSTWGAAVVWYEWMPLSGHWGINWGIAVGSVAEARAVRRFLNSRVARPNRHGGVLFAEVVRIAQFGRPPGGAVRF